MPCQKCLRGDNSGQFVKDSSAQLFGLNCQAPVLVIVQARPIAAELFAKDAVLFPELINDLLLLLVHPAGQGNQ